MRIPLFLTTLGILALLSPPGLAADVVVKLSAGDGFVVKDNTGTIDRFRVDEATGNITRNDDLFVHTTNGSLFVGQQAGNTSITGIGANTAFGWFALHFDTTGHSNSAFGFDALQANTVGSGNSAFGISALLQNQVGDNNSAFGAAALRDNVLGTDNSAFGTLALRVNDGINNAAFGSASLYSNSSGGSNVAIGGGSLGLNTTGSSNVAVGVLAGINQTTGSYNIYLANQGVAGESGQIRIGVPGTHTDTHLVGDVTTTASLTVGSTTLDEDITVHDANGDSSAIVNLRLPFKDMRMVIDSGTQGYIGTGEGLDLALRVEGFTRMVFKTNGNNGLGTSTPSYPLEVGSNGTNGNGAHVTAGGTWTNGSSRAFKEGFERVDSVQVLARVTALPIGRWRYRDSQEGEHLGPVAEDFHAAFGLGGDERYIATIDADGVALAAIQGLHEIVVEQRQQLAVLRERVARLEAGQ